MLDQDVVLVRNFEDVFYWQLGALWISTQDRLIGHLIFWIFFFLYCWLRVYATWIFVSLFYGLKNSIIYNLIVFWQTITMDFWKYAKLFIFGLAMVVLAMGALGTSYYLMIFSHVNRLLLYKYFLILNRTWGVLIVLYLLSILFFCAYKEIRRSKGEGELIISTPAISNTILVKTTRYIIMFIDDLILWLKKKNYNINAIIADIIIFFFLSYIVYNKAYILAYLYNFNMILQLFILIFSFFGVLMVVLAVFELFKVDKAEQYQVGHVVSAICLVYLITGWFIIANYWDYIIVVFKELSAIINSIIGLFICAQETIVKDFNMIINYLHPYVVSFLDYTWPGLTNKGVTVSGFFWFWYSYLVDTLYIVSDYLLAALFILVFYPLWFIFRIFFVLGIMSLKIIVFLWYCFYYGCYTVKFIICNLNPKSFWYLISVLGGYKLFFYSLYKTFLYAPGFLNCVYDYVMYINFDNYPVFRFKSVLVEEYTGVARDLFSEGVIISFSILCVLYLLLRLIAIEDNMKAIAKERHFLKAMRYICLLSFIFIFPYVDYYLYNSTRWYDWYSSYFVCTGCTLGCENCILVNTFFSGLWHGVYLFVALYLIILMLLYIVFLLKGEYEYYKKQEDEDEYYKKQEESFFVKYILADFFTAMVLITISLHFFRFWFFYF